MTTADALLLLMSFPGWDAQLNEVQYEQVKRAVHCVNDQIKDAVKIQYKICSQLSKYHANVVSEAILSCHSSKKNDVN